MKIGVIVFPSTNCDFDVEQVLREIVKVNVERIWYKNRGNIKDCDAIVIPGGFSYGDYLRAGAIAAKVPMMDDIKEISGDGMPILGICNGFQILCEAGLLEGSLSVNASTKFICGWVNLRVENSENTFTRFYKKSEVIRIPINHMEGRYVADKETLNRLNENGQVLFRYCDAEGKTTPKSNPNGSLENIAGICNTEGNIVGLMPHPERASEKILGGKDGLKMFLGMIDDL